MSIEQVQASMQVQSEPHEHWVVLYASLWKANKVHSNAKIFVAISIFLRINIYHTVAKIYCNFLIVKKFVAFLLIGS